MDKITASIVVYKSNPAELERAIKSFQSSALAGELFIVDNSPTPDAREVCLALGCQYIFAGSNLGYGKAHNLVMRNILGRTSYHLVLNPDVYFEADVLEKLFLFMEEHHQAGLVMPKVLYPDGTLQHLCKLLPTPLNLATRRFWPFSRKLLSGMNNQYEMGFSHYNKVMNVPFLSGCFMFLRTASLRKTGLFDERFFLYAEDTDLSRRLHREFKTMFYPFAEIYHTHGRGSYKDLGLMWRNLMSAVRYFNKWGWVFDAERRTINEAAASPFTTVKSYGTAGFQEATVAQRSMND